MDNNKIEYKPNRKMALLCMLMGPFFLWGSYAMWNEQETTYYRRRRPIGRAVLKYLGVPMGILFGIFGLQKLLDNKPALVLTSDGIESNISAIGLKKTKWSNIVFLELKPDGVLYLNVIDDQEAVRKDNLVIEATNALNKSMLGTATTIPLKGTVDGDPLDVAKVIIQYWEKYSGYTNELA